ncbi:MAG: hypothetical protein IPM06_16930 [Rhizobiales bacterium]|nr:hypothetical protein [Hyphomicrobiales bacterium]
MATKPASTGSVRKSGLDDTTSLMYLPLAQQGGGRRALRSQGDRRIDGRDAAVGVADLRAGLDLVPAQRLDCPAACCMHSDENLEQRIFVGVLHEAEYGMKSPNSSSVAVVSDGRLGAAGRHAFRRAGRGSQRQGFVAPELGDVRRIGRHHERLAELLQNHVGVVAPQEGGAMAYAAVRLEMSPDVRERWSWCFLSVSLGVVSVLCRLTYGIGMMRSVLGVVSLQLDQELAGCVRGGKSWRAPPVSTDTGSSRPAEQSP